MDKLFKCHSLAPNAEDIVMLCVCHMNPGSPFRQATPRQVELLTLLARQPGATNYDLAQQMRVSERTVKRYLSDIYRIAGVQNRSECLSLLLRKEPMNGQQLH